MITALEPLIKPSIRTVLEGFEFDNAERVDLVWEILPLIFHSSRGLASLPLFFIYKLKDQPIILSCFSIRPFMHQHYLTSKEIRHMSYGKIKWFFPLPLFLIGYYFLSTVIYLFSGLWKQLNNIIALLPAHKMRLKPWIFTVDVGEVAAVKIPLSSKVTKFMSYSLLVISFILYHIYITGCFIILLLWLSFRYSFSDFNSGITFSFEPFIFCICSNVCQLFSYVNLELQKWFNHDC